MPTISDKLRSMGVKVGTKDIPPPAIKNDYPIEEVIEGYLKETPYGCTFIVESRFPIKHHQGLISIDINSPLDIVAEYIGDQRISQLKIDEFIFFDTETSGLSGGTGTFAFLIGAGRFEDDCFHLFQYFLRDPIEETAQLHALSEFVGSKQGIVTFNGKTFDVPLLNSRYTINSDLSPFKTLANIDLLPLARSLWRDQLQSRKLTELERHILGFQRAQEDVPGWMVPSLYFDYIKNGDARPIKSVFYHNAMDIISMAALLNYITIMLSNPLDNSVREGIDLVALGKIFQNIGHFDTAADLYAYALDSNLPPVILRKALFYWSYMEKRRENLSTAIELWEQAAAEKEIFAHIELAKYHEHRNKDYLQAVFWTQAALKLVKSRTFSQVEKQQILPEIEHRLARLKRKKANENKTISSK
jgi:uncharacterized protein YprB with RNaseH-like and TPR domain